MKLEIRRPDHVVPEYSLTGDLLSFKSCEMAYRYYNGSSLPPSRPVQLWYGEFIHGVLESAYKLWDRDRVPFPWPYTEIEPGSRPELPPASLDRYDLRKVAWPIETALLQQGKRARNDDARRAAYRRAHAAINFLGPHLFPLINSAEEKVIGTRMVPLRNAGAPLRADRYVLTGVIDVVTDVELSSVPAGNRISQAIRLKCPGLSGRFEVIVDYKGSRRPPMKPLGNRAHKNSAWELGEWQVQTYGWLRKHQPDTPEVAAGILIYINEFSPGSNDVVELRREIEKGATDIRPLQGDRDDYTLRVWRPGSDPVFSEDFLWRRALRVIEIDEGSISKATSAFDETVRDIEANVADEALTGSIMTTWTPNCTEYQTCVACDFQSFCPKPAQRPAGVVPEGDEA